MRNSRIALLAALTTCVASVTGCATAAPPIAAAALHGCYEVGDATRYERKLLQLKADGTYYGEYQGHITLWGSATGTWRVENNKLVLTSTHVTDQPPLPDRLILERHAQGVELRIPKGGILWKNPFTTASCDSMHWQGTLFGHEGAPPPIPDGEYTFHHRFAEHPTMPSVDMQVRFHDGRTTVTNTTPASPFPVGVIADGVLLWNGKRGTWIIGRTPADRDATEVGGCSDGPEVVDLEQRIYWTC